MIEGLGLKEETLAHHILSERAEPIWAACEGHFGGLVAPSTEASADGLGVRLLSSEDRAFFSPEVAALFLSTNAIREAVQRGGQLWGLVPEAQRGVLSPLFDFLRGMATRSEASADTLRRDDRQDDRWMAKEVMMGAHCSKSRRLVKRNRLR